MYRPYSLLILLLLFCTPSVIVAQQCHDYACVVRKVEKLLSAKTKDYKILLDNLDSAESYPDSKAEEVRKLRRRVFEAIENEKNEAKKARDEANKQTEIAKNEKERADQKAEEVQKQVEIVKVEKERADQKTKELEIAHIKLDSFYKFEIAQKDRETRINTEVYRNQLEKYQRELVKLNKELDSLEKIQKAQITQIYHYDKDNKMVKREVKLKLIYN